MLALLSLLSVFFVIVRGDDLLVDTTLGKVMGHFNSAGAREWKGIRYAQPPVGANRWKYPISPEASSSIFVADFDAPGCPQLCNLPPGNCPEFGLSEDCLFLSVMAPSKPSSDPNGYPVFFWIHGGAFEQGLGNCALYNGTYFALSDVVTVVINYRLGALGFMASTSMDGNYGFMDQRLALEWTRANIRGFGGNPDAITIGGQSAGGMSVGCHLTSPKSQGLFKQSILESYPFGLPFHTRESASKNADAMMNYLGCAVNDVDCMRTKSVDQVLDAQKNAIKLDANTLFINFLPFTPLVEPNGEIPEQPLFAMMHGSLKQAPILSGSVSDEGQLFVYELFTKSLSKVAYNAIIDAVFGRYAKDILSYYPFDLVPNNQDGRNVLNVLATDLLFYCPLRNVTRGYQSVLGNDAIPSFVYRFEHLISFDCWGPNYTFCLNSVCHGSELPFVFNVFTDGVSVSYTPTSDEQTLTQEMGAAWANFISFSDPNKGMSVPVAYPLYNSASDSVVELNEPGMKDGSHLRDSYCNLWDRLGFFW